MIIRVVVTGQNGAVMRVQIPYVLLDTEEGRALSLSSAPAVLIFVVGTDLDMCHFYAIFLQPI